MREIVKALQSVYQKKVYVLVTLTLAIFFFFVAALVPSLATLENAFTSSILNKEAKLSVFVDALFVFRIGYKPVQQVLVLIGVVFVSINLTLLLQHIKKRAAVQRAGGAGLLGVIVGTLGLGCSACGTFLLSSLLGVTAAGALIAALPLGGAEFLVLGDALLIYSIYSIAKKINEPMVCQPVLPKK